MENLKNKKFHFIAIGGVGMSGLAKYLTELGADVSGSDIEESKYTNLLKTLGTKVYIGHNADYIKENMIVVASSAIKGNNPEIIRAKELNLKIYHRSDILKMISDEFSQNPNSIFIGFSGTHGKTTTSGMCAYVLEKAGYNPSYVVGGIIPEINTNGKYNNNKYFTAELDESDGTIEKYSTDIAVINNLEEDHLDFYKNGFSDITKTFNKYLSNKPNQKVIINKDNDGNINFMKLYPDYNYITFGEQNADYTIKNIRKEKLSSFFDVYHKDKFLVSIHLTIPGNHNIYNALAVISALNESNINIERIKEYFTTFSGMGRRFQKVGEYKNISIYDDYAHHPSEIQTTLKSIKEAIGEENRLVAIFQPHRYTRLQSLWNEFKESFKYADKLIITDVYPAGENPIADINSKNFSEEIKHKNAIYIPGGIEEIPKQIFPMLNKNDIVITLGAGTVTKLGKYILKEAGVQI